MNIPRTIRQIPQRQHNEDRLRRAKSWLRRSKEAKDDTERFIFLWIAFNAAYGREAFPSHSDKQRIEREKLRTFLQEVLKRDDNGVLEETLWHTYSGPIRILLDNHYVFAPFWDAVRDRDPTTGKNWKKKFSDSKRRVQRSIGRNVHHVLTELFMRLYTLRNQIIHGGATFATGWGQDQVRDGSRIMESLVPLILKIMQADIKEDPESEVWGLVDFPRVNDGPR